MLRARVLVVLLILGRPIVVLAHDPGLSSLEVRVARAQIEAQLALAATDAAAAGDRDVADAIEMTIDGTRLPVTVARVETDDGGSVRIRLVSSRPAGRRLVIASRIPQLVARGHRQLVSVRDVDGNVLAEQMLDAAGGEVAVDLVDGGTATVAATSFFRLGVEHIAGGYDHLLFVAVLLLGMRRMADAVKAVTAFTAAHSLTLATSALGWFDFSPAVVEPLIAASIVYVAAENLAGTGSSHRWKLTFGFGLIYGFGFAAALREIGVGQNGAGIVLPLAAFNLGVEAGQVAIVAAVMPLLAKVQAQPALARPIVTVGSVLTIAAGCYWLVERLVP